MPTSCDKCPFFDTMVDGICSLLHKTYDFNEIGLRMDECPLVVVEEKEIGGQKVLIEVAEKENDQCKRCARIGRKQNERLK